MNINKRLHLLAVTLIAIGPFTTEAEGAVMIDFNDGLAAGSPIGAFYAELGVTFSNGEWVQSSGAFTPHPDSTGLMLIGSGANYQPKADNPISFTFSGPVLAVSIIANSVNANGVRMDLYDAEVGGALVGFHQETGPSGSLDSNVLLTASGAGIRRVELYQPFSLESEGILFDNLQFTPIPEPSSVLFLGVGTLAWLIRRRKTG